MTDQIQDVSALCECHDPRLWVSIVVGSTLSGFGWFAVVFLLYSAFGVPLIWGGFAVASLYVIRTVAVDPFTGGERFLPPGYGWLEFVSATGGVFLAALILLLTVFRP